MTQLTDQQWRLLIQEVEARVALHAPEWTDHDESDPSITLLELLSFLTESLLLRADRIPEHGRPLVTRAITALGSLSSLCGTSRGLIRNHFFAGRLLAVDDFETEQSYFVEKHRRHNRELHGAGIVDGLKVTVNAGSSQNAASITVSPGFAITPRGDEICVPEAVTCNIGISPSPCYVTVRYVDRFIDPTPTATLYPTNSALHIVEGFVVTFEATLDEAAVPLARMKRKHAKWSVDQAFRPSRLRHGG